MAKEQEKIRNTAQKNTLSGLSKRSGVSQEVLKSAKKQIKKYTADLEYLKGR